MLLEYQSGLQCYRAMSDVEFLCDYSTRSPLPPPPSPAYFNARLLTDSLVPAFLVPCNAAKDQTDCPLVFRPDRAARIDNFFA